MHSSSQSVHKTDPCELNNIGENIEEQSMKEMTHILDGGPLEREGKCACLIAQRISSLSVELDNARSDEQNSVFFSSVPSNGCLPKNESKNGAVHNEEGKGDKFSSGAEPGACTLRSTVFADLEGVSDTQSGSWDTKFVPKHFLKFEQVLGYVNQYILFEEVGRGAQGTVYKCLNRENNRDYALKMLQNASLKKRKKRFPRGNDNIDILNNEIEVMKQIDHPNIVRLHEVIDDVKNDKLYLVMDFVRGGSVIGDHDVMNCKDPSNIAVDEDEARMLFFDFALGMEHLHAKGILHRDIKPSNLLIDVDACDGVRRCRVCDFGVSALCSMVKSAKILGEDDLVYAGESCGTPMMMAPESLSTSPGQVFHGRPADVWAAGVTLFMILTGTFPFPGKDGDSIDGLARRIINDSISFPSKPKISREAKKLIGKMLKKKPEDRITFSLILEDSWFTKGFNTTSPRSFESGNISLGSCASFERKISLDGKYGREEMYFLPKLPYFPDRQSSCGSGFSIVESSDVYVQHPKCSRSMRNKSFNIMTSKEAIEERSYGCFNLPSGHRRRAASFSHWKSSSGSSIRRKFSMTGKGTASRIQSKTASDKEEVSKEDAEFINRLVRGAS